MAELTERMPNEAQYALSFHIVRALALQESEGVASLGERVVGAMFEAGIVTRLPHRFVGVAYRFSEGVVNGLQGQRRIFDCAQSKERGVQHLSDDPNVGAL